MTREFHNPALPTTAELEALLDGSDTYALAEALIGLALNSADLTHALAVVTGPRVVGHADPGVRGAAVLCLGHLARIRSLQEVVFVAHDRQEIEVVRRETDGSWSRHVARDGEVVRLVSLGCELSVSDVYANPLAP